MKESVKKIVVFTGAGVSADSGLSTFRDADGLWDKYRIEDVCTPEALARNREKVVEFYNIRRRELLGCSPNAGHEAIRRLEDHFDVDVITQNIDGLHQKAGSRKVLELHGSVLRNHCTRCGQFYGVERIVNSRGVPRCSCGGIIKPDVVLYEEGLDSCTINKSVDYISKADILIIGGTSLAVYPAAGLIDYYRGSKLVLINKDATARDSQADLVISDPIGEGLGTVVD